MGAFNGTGTFVRTYDWTTDLGNNIPITASRFDTEDDGFATGLSTCITKDGQTTITANIPFNSRKITGLGNGSARTDSIALGQVQDNSYEYLGENGGSANAYTWGPSPAITAYTAGQSWIILIGSGDGNTGASTAAISGLSTRSIVKSDGAGSTTAVESGDMVAGSLYKLIDDGTNLVLQNPEKPYLIGVNFSGVNNRNLLINGGFAIDQRNSGATTAISDDNYCFDRWYILTQTASVNVSQQTLQEDGQATNGRITQNQASAQRFGIAQIIEAADSQNERGKILSFIKRVRASNSQALRYAVLEWTGTADSVTSDVVNDWTSSTYTAGNFFISSNINVLAVGNLTPSATVWTDLTTLNATVGSSANNLIVFVWTEGTAAQNFTLDVGKAKLERGSNSTTFVAKSISEEKALCDRFFSFNYSGSGKSTTTTTIGVTVSWKEKRTNSPTVSIFNGTNKGVDIGNALRNITSISATEGLTSTGAHMTLVIATTTNAATHGLLSECLAIDDEL